MFCRECGTQNPDDSKFCESCGTAFARGSSPGASTPAPAAPGRDTPAHLLGDLEPSTRVGDYEIVEVLGEGGMGTVYRARHTRLGHEVAIKVLASNLAHSATLMERFENEARVQAQMRHPHIVAVHDFICRGSVCAIVMDLVQGDPLDDIIHTQTGPMPLQRCRGLLIPVLEAVGYAHSRAAIS